MQKKQLSPINLTESIEYKNVELLKNFITEQGKILPRSTTGVTVQQQRVIAKAIKRARILALLPFTNANAK